MAIKEVQTRLNQGQSVSDQAGFCAVHVLGALVQVTDHTGDTAHSALTEQPFSTACRHTAPQAQTGIPDVSMEAEGVTGDECQQQPKRCEEDLERRDPGRFRDNKETRLRLEKVFPLEEMQL